MIYSIFNQNIDAVKNNQQNLETLVISNDQLIPTVSYWAIQKSISLLQELTQFYSPLLGFSEADLSRLIPLLIFVEATIYQIDEEYENNINNHQFTSEHIAVLRNVLTQLNLFDDKLENELQNGLALYRLEQQFCSGRKITQNDIDLVVRVKCFDIAIFHRILYKATNQTYDEEILEICRIMEQIYEIYDDFKDYKKDVSRNVINIYRMFVRLYDSNATKQIQHYLEILNSSVQHRLQLLEKTRPDIAKNLIELCNAESNNYVVPEIPQPILEDYKKFVNFLIY